jgi:hypothetical protein
VNHRIQKFIERHAVDPGKEGTLTPPVMQAVPESKTPLAKREPAPPAAPVSLNRHARKCSICRHPDRYDIEQDFLRWYSPISIAEDYNLPDHSSVYRHARALGLVEVRGRNLRVSLDGLIERIDRTAVTADAIVKAVRFRAHINADGEWVNPPTTHRIVIETRAASPDSAAPALPEGSTPPLPENPNRQLPRLENDATC